VLGIPTNTSAHVDAKADAITNAKVHSTTYCGELHLKELVERQQMCSEVQQDNQVQKGKTTKGMQEIMHISMHLQRQVMRIHQERWR